MTAVWRIYFGDGSMKEGANAADWRAAADRGVQVVARFPMLGPLRWTCNSVPVRDRDLWTGEDEYDPFGWGVKRGSLIARAAYDTIWERACGDSAT